MRQSGFGREERSRTRGGSPFEDNDGDDFHRSMRWKPTINENTSLGHVLRSILKIISVFKDSKTHELPSALTRICLFRATKKNITIQSLIRITTILIQVAVQFSSTPIPSGRVPEVGSAFNDGTSILQFHDL
jgi:hypothetical protein